MVIRRMDTQQIRRYLIENKKANERGKGESV
jgi:hypothetical protein